MLFNSLSVYVPTPLIVDNDYGANSDDDSANNDDYSANDNNDCAGNDDDCVTDDSGRANHDDCTNYLTI